MTSARLPILAALTTGIFLHAIPAAAQALTVPDGPRVRQALDYIARTEPQAIEEQVALCQIAAPPFMETRRGEELKRRLEAQGLTARVDSVGNVIAERRGDPGEPVIVISGHLDTVLPDGTDVQVRREGTILRGPGIADDCRGLAVVLAVARALDQAQIRTRGTVIFVGTVGEEGLGDLRGVRNLFGRELKGRVDYFISVDGVGLGITRDAVGSHRYKVTFRSPGGHSYGDFGIPNPMHALGRAIAKIADFQVPDTPRVTFSVGVVEGGTSVNSIAGEASFSLDMRSVDPARLDSLDARFRAAVQQAVDEENARWHEGTHVTADIRSIGLRPAGTQPADAPIVRAAIDAGRRLGFTPQTGASSTDSNIPISLGIPALTIDGGGTGGGAHSLGEWFDSKDSHVGTQWALLLVLALAGMR